MNANASTATFGGGCFWCMEAVFERVQGVKSVTSGYAGGSMSDPTYKQVCSDDTGHAEAIQIEFDPAKLTYENGEQPVTIAGDRVALKHAMAEVLLNALQANGSDGKIEVSTF